MNGPKIVVNLQQSTDTSDGMGGFTKTWTTVRELKGTMTQNFFKNSKERFIHDTTKVFSTHTFHCRWQKDLSVNETWRINYNSENYDIVLVNNVGQKNIYMILDLLRVR